MIYKLLFLIFILIILNHICNCTECFDFQCFDGGIKSDSNCFKCTNVSTIAKKLWFQNFEQLIYVSKKLKKLNLAKQYEKKRDRGMFCCSLTNSFEQNTCSLSLASGTRDGITHFGMSCITPSIWYSSMCREGDLGARCCNENHCNTPNISELKHSMDVLKSVNPLFENSGKDKYEYPLIILIIIMSICLFGILVFCIVLVIKALHNKSDSKSESSQNKSFYKRMHCFVKFFTSINVSKRRKKVIAMGDISSFSDSTMQRNNSFEFLPCSGSGAGKPLMTKRTAATDISLVRIVGDGRFGTVWLGKWNGDNVAVKIFSTRDERSWDREKQMYQKNFLRHSNVLGYIATDSRDNGMSTELWLVTDYHENGSLYDYLRSHVLSVEQAVKMVRSITNGLAYLHIEISGTELRPGIAHRDLKSRNILVKSSGECCIGDLGLAVRLNEDCSALDTNRVGTRRYMAPEVIMDKIVITDLYYNGGLEAFKKADIYSYSLVLWEILNRCECPSMRIESSLYEMPYQNLVSSDPSIDEMRDIVCVKKMRPTLSASWDCLNPLKEISKSIHESWFEDPASRLTIMRLKKIMANVWTEVLTLTSTMTDISIDDSLTTTSNTDPIEKYATNNSFVSTEFPSSVTSNDIPNIVIRTAGNILITDTYGVAADLSANTT